MAGRDANITSPILYRRPGMFKKHSIHSLLLFNSILTMERPGTTLLVCKHFSFIICSVYAEIAEKIKYFFSFHARLIF